MKRDDPLREDQVGNPILWLVPTNLPVPLVEDHDVEPAFGGGNSRKIKSWGHGEDGVHWLATRSGTALHTDPAYARYSHHLIVRNDGYRIRGVDDSAQPPPMEPGVIYCLDTHSPHEVTDDDRLGEFGKPRYKVQLVLDTDEVMKPEDVFPLFRAALGRGMHPRHGAGDAPRQAPRSN